jgi:hypothetical protein
MTTAQGLANQSSSLANDATKASAFGLSILPVLNSLQSRGQWTKTGDIAQTAIDLANTTMSCPAA